MAVRMIAQQTTVHRFGFAELSAAVQGRGFVYLLG
jgi:hypothetical protein